MIPSAFDHLQEIAGSDRRLAIFLDYDGTLTPIISQPAQALLSDSMRQKLRTLAAHVPLAILTGRDLEDIRRRVDIGGIVYAGCHGFDIAGPRGLRKQVATEFLPILDAAEKELREKLAAIPGALLERKRLSIAVHYRQATGNGVTKITQAVDETIARHHELTRVVGKKVYELLPGVAWNKGRAILWLLETLGLDQPEVLPLYVGDDHTDEDAFRALANHGISIVVNEQPRPTAARFALKDPAEVERFLRELTAWLIQ
jgi:trehalose-phosphatase